MSECDTGWNARHETSQVEPSRVSFFAPTLLSIRFYLSRAPIISIILTTLARFSISFSASSCLFLSFLFSLLLSLFPSFPLFLCLGSLSLCLSLSLSLSEGCGKEPDVMRRSAGEIHRLCPSLFFSFVPRSSCLARAALVRTLLSLLLSPPLYLSSHLLLQLLFHRICCFDFFSGLAFTRESVYIMLWFLPMYAFFLFFLRASFLFPSVSGTYPFLFNALALP